MSVTLAKGGNVSLSTVAPHLSAVEVGLGWRARPGGREPADLAEAAERGEPVDPAAAPFDLDASALLCAHGRVLGDDWFVFYNNLKSPDGSVEHMGDELRGGTGAQDDETIQVDLEQVPPEVDAIVFCVSIYEAEIRGQNFGRVSDAYIRVVDQADGSELARYDLTGEASEQTAMVFGELVRAEADGPSGRGDWRFHAVGRGYPTGLRGIALQHGVNVQ
ncbi:TerD family protein [Phaeacidiphilus oryzae]|jgi:tellurium resistance protein TerD|uniref:TerD family protein n=1 Tax=Phaeacidiphilus oryzae TaxID=348818 RepID=UPI0005647333|nr:TerD family protein [Phaeacidiphilus oryzae]